MDPPQARHWQVAEKASSLKLEVKTSKSKVKNTAKN
jgi:hypothetical protein